MKKQDVNQGYHDRTPRLMREKSPKFKSNLSKGISIFLVIAASILFYFLFLRMDIIKGGVDKILDILTPIFYGMVIAYLLNPLVKRVNNKLEPFFEKRIKKQGIAQKIALNLSILTGLIALVLLVVLLFAMIIPELINSVTGLVETLPGQVNALIRDIDAYVKNNESIGEILDGALLGVVDFFVEWIQGDLLSDVNKIVTYFTSGVFSAVGIVIDILIGLIVAVYLLTSKVQFLAQAKKAVYAIFSVSKANIVLHIARKSNYIMGGFIIGKIIDSLIIGVLAFISLSIMNMPYTLLVSVIIGVTNVIPFFGPFIGAIPSAFLILLDDPMKCVYFIIFIFVLQQVDGNIIGPKILGDSTGLSAFWVLFSILLGGGLFGFAGMIFGVPTFAVIYYIISAILNERLEHKQLPIGSAEYTHECYVDPKSGAFVEMYEETNRDVKRDTIKEVYTETKDESED